MTKTLWVPVLLILLTTALAAIGALYRRVRMLEAGAVKVATQVEPLWSMIQAKMARELTHPSREFHVADDLLVTLVEGDISETGRQRLLDLMEQRVTDPNPKIGVLERETAGAMAFVMRRAQEEKETSAPVEELKLVEIRETKPNGEPKP